MRRKCVSVAFGLLAMVGPVRAAEKGDFKLGIKALPYFRQGRDSTEVGTHWKPSVQYQLTNHLSLRPELAFADGSRGSRWDLGLSTFYSPKPQASRSPYFGAGLTYTRDTIEPGYRVDDEGRLQLGPAPARPKSSFVTLSSVAGVEMKLSQRIGLFAEAGVAWTPGGHHRWDGRQWAKANTFDAKAPFRSGFGLSFRWP